MIELKAKRAAIYTKVVKLSREAVRSLLLSWLALPSTARSMMVGRVFLVLTGACQFGDGVGGFTTNFIHSCSLLLSWPARYLRILSNFARVLLARFACCLLRYATAFVYAAFFLTRFCVSPRAP